jgi:transcriptional regulator with XRE-family HTH domain
VDVVHTLAANLNKIMAALKDRKDPRGSNAGLAKAIGGGFSSNTIGRARRGDGSITLRKLTLIAKALQTTALQLLAPNFDYQNPPEVISDPDEKLVIRMYRKKHDPDSPTTTLN